MIALLEGMARRVMFARDPRGALVFFPRAMWFGLEGRGFLLPEEHRADEITRTATRHYVRQSVMA